MASSSANSADSISIRASSAGSFKFEIDTAGYPCSINSPIFTFEGHDWCLMCHIFPSKDVAIALYLMSEGETVKASVDLSLLDRDGHASSDAFKREVHTFTSQPSHRLCLGVLSHTLENYLTEDRFTVHFMIFVADENRKPCDQISELGPDKLLQDLESMLKSREMSDVTFEVDGEIFHAHKLVLAARSPVFKAELFGSMVEANKECIKVEGMNSEVFRVLLRYMYTDSISSIDTSLTQHLLVAADRYALDGLKTVCEERLCKDVTLDTVLSSLALADQHNCSKLLATCLDFAAAPENLLKLTLSREYLDLMTSCPSLFAELGKRASNSFSSITIINRSKGGAVDFSV